MTFNPRSLSLFNASPFGTAGLSFATYTYGTADAAATVLAAGYFNDVRSKLKVNDVIFAMCGADATGDFLTIRVTAAPVSGNVTVQSDADVAGGGTRAVVPTADGLTTGLILPTDSFVEATSAGADNILCLPAASAATRGRQIWIWVVPSTNCELQTHRGSSDTINNVNCGGGAVEALLTHTQLYLARQHLATGWLLQAFTALGAVGTAIIPD